MAVPGLSPGPVIGAGGYLGAAGRGLLEAHFASVGAYILTLSVILCGLLLCTDYLLLQAGGAWLLRGPALGLGRGLLHVLAAYAQRLGLEQPAAGGRKKTRRSRPRRSGPLRRMRAMRKAAAMWRSTSPARPHEGDAAAAEQPSAEDDATDEADRASRRRTFARCCGFASQSRSRTRGNDRGARRRQPQTGADRYQLPASICCCRASRSRSRSRRRKSAARR